MLNPIHMPAGLRITEGVGRLLTGVRTSRVDYFPHELYDVCEQ